MTLEVLWAVAPDERQAWTTAQVGFGWGLVLAGTDLPARHALDPASGRDVWKVRTDTPPRTLGIAGEEVFVGTFDGTLDAYRKVESDP